MAHSSRGPGRRPLTPVTRVRIPYALPAAPGVESSSSRCSLTYRSGSRSWIAWSPGLSCPKGASSHPPHGATCSMAIYLLDTNACIALINGTEASVRRRFQRAVARDGVALLSSIVAFELWYEVAKSQRKDSNRQRLEAFFAGPLEWTLL